MSFTERRQRITDRESELVFLTISAPSLQESLRLVNDTQNWTSQGIEYIGFPFGFDMPTDAAGQVPRARLVIDNVGRAITEDLERLQPGELLIAMIAISDRANPDVYERVYRLPMTNVTATAAQVTAQLGVDFMTRQQAVRLRFNPYLTPGLF